MNERMVWNASYRSGNEPDGIDMEIWRYAGKGAGKTCGREARLAPYYHVYDTEKADRKGYG